MSKEKEKVVKTPEEEFDGKVAKLKKGKVVKTPEEEFDERVAELKEGKSKAELLKMVSVQPAGHEIFQFIAARKALDELEVKYSKSFA